MIIASLNFRIDNDTITIPPGMKMKKPAQINASFFA
jgi:hypothetical protein